MGDLSELPEIVGQYQIVRELGSGATGRVYFAERIQGFEQSVALKILRWTPNTRFPQEAVEDEQTILRSLEHPNIVAFLDHGKMADGAPFLVLEYIDGKPIDIWCDSHRLLIHERLRLLTQIFSAVAYAHSRLVLHGDIKPSNIMVTTSLSGNGSPIAKLLDFGVSRWLHGGRVASGSMAMTLAYASPEQRHGDPLTVATDVFALGVLMSNLLSGTKTGSDVGKSSMSTYLAELDSSRLQEIARQRGTTPRNLARLLRGPLDAIVQKATAQIPKMRYATVAAMAEDVNRYLENMETSVFPLSRPRQAMLWMRRHAWLTGLAAMLSAILLIGGGLTLWRHHRVVLQERETHARLLELARLTDDLSGALYRSTESLSGTEQARASLLRAASEARDAVAQENVHDPELSLELARQYAAAAELELTLKSKAANRQAQQEIDRARTLLKDVPDTQLRSQTEEKLKRLQALLATSS